MTWLVLLAALVVILLLYGWYLTWLAGRLDRAHRRVERSWAVLDAALTHRANLVLALATGTDAVRGEGEAQIAVAMTTLVPTARADREWVESNLTRIVDPSDLPSSIKPPGWDDAHQRVVVARRIHNDAVAVARNLRRRRTVIIFRLAGHATEPSMFEMVDRPVSNPYAEADEAGLAEPSVAR